ASSPRLDLSNPRSYKGGANSPLPARGRAAFLFQLANPLAHPLEPSRLREQSAPLQPRPLPSIDSLQPMFSPPRRCPVALRSAAQLLPRGAPQTSALCIHSPKSLSCTQFAKTKRSIAALPPPGHLALS